MLQYIPEQTQNDPDPLSLPLFRRMIKYLYFKMDYLANLNIPLIHSSKHLLYLLIRVTIRNRIWGVLKDTEMYCFDVLT